MRKQTVRADFQPDVRKYSRSVINSKKHVEPENELKMRNKLLHKLLKLTLETFVR
jgi:hypothetical protein